MSSNDRINPRILILFMIVGILPLGVGSLVLLNGARANHVEESKALLSTIADNAQSALNNYLQHQILQVAAIGAVPDVRESVLRSNPNPVTAEEEQIESDWEQLDANESRLLQSILQNPTSVFLRHYSQTAPAFTEIIVTDVHGRLVAATNKTSDYFQADERWWQHAYRQGVGGHFLGDIRPDRSAEVDALVLADPIIDPATNTAVGVVKAAFDAQEIFGLVNSIELSNGLAFLMRGDGSIVASQRASSTGGKYPYYQEVLEAVASGRHSVDVGSGQDKLCLGLAKSIFRETYSELDWYLVVQEPHPTATGPFSKINLHFLYVLVFSIIVVLVLSFVFSKVLSKPIIETDPHLDKL